MKATLRIPDKTPYAYIEVEVNGEVSDILTKYFELKEKFEARYQESLKSNKRNDDF